MVNGLKCMCVKSIRYERSNSQAGCIDLILLLGSYSCTFSGNI